MAAMTPNAGSAYGFTRGAFGELMGWIVGWDLVLEYSISGAAVAQGWSNYFQSFLKLCGAEFPSIVSTTPFAYDATSNTISSTGSVFDLLTIIITALLTLLLIYGMQESAKFNTICVVLKVFVVLFVIIAGAIYVNPDNFSPFLPFGFAGISFFGNTVVGQSSSSGNSVGVLAGSSIVFFSYMGFDAVATNSEECKNPQRDLPIGIIGSLIISTFLYIATCIVLVGMVPYDQIDTEAPISSAFGSVGLYWAEYIVAIGAILGLTTVLLVNLMG